MKIGTWNLLLYMLIPKIRFFRMLAQILTVQKEQTWRKEQNLEVSPIWLTFGTHNSFWVLNLKMWYVFENLIILMPKRGIKKRKKTEKRAMMNCIVLVKIPILPCFTIVVGPLVPPVWSKFKFSPFFNVL